jgi:hypothetical protein
MPAKRGDSQFDYPEYAEFHLRCNPGHDFIRFIGWLDKAPPEKFSDTLLRDAQMEDLWWRQSYAEKQKPTRFQRDA